MSKSGNGINFYSVYRDSQRTKKASTRLVGIIPLILLFAAIAAATVYIRLGNVDKSMALDGVTRQIAQLDEEYQTAQALSEESASLIGLADALQTDADIASELPILDRNLFANVISCAADTFKISVYRYDEDARMLEIDAAAPSVNDMPDLVEALRDTGLFSSVQYVGYTSDTDGVYYCTIGCVLVG